jgi:hypothetical protein
MNEAAEPRPTRRPDYLTGTGLLLLAVLSVAPLVLERTPVEFAAPHAGIVADWGSKGLVLLGMGAAVGLAAWQCRRTDPRPVLLALALVATAGVLTACHGVEVDRITKKAKWQREVYFDVLNQRGNDHERWRVPHQFRPLPFGFTRTLELLTGDWWFACTAYRWFFTYWFLWGWFRFARLFLCPSDAVLTLMPLAVLYPFSICWYWGQLTDPMSHALFVLALVTIVQDRWLCLAAALVLGVMTKETAVLLVPAYLACTWRRGLPALARTAFLGVACVAAFLAVRLPLGWAPGLGDLNGTEDLMVASNLGLGDYKGAPGLGLPTLLHNCLHLAFFFGVFLPFIVKNWRQTDARLRALFLTLTPLLLLSSFCFSWVYESRNYLPLMPVVVTMSAPPDPRRRSHPQDPVPAKACGFEPHLRQ